MRGLVYAYGKWIGGDPTSFLLGAFTDSVTTHYGGASGWQFGILILYASGLSAIVHELQLIGLTGRVNFNENPVVWTSYSHDGESWSQEKSVSVGKQGEHAKRIAWRQQGVIRNSRTQKFRGESRISIAALEATFEPLSSGS